MVTPVKINLSQDEYTALLLFAVADLRNPADQARFILRQELDRLGWLSPATLPKADLSSNPGAP